MKIVHCCLSCFYIDGYSYQENELVRQNVIDGHDVLVVASTEMYGEDRRLTYISPGEYVGREGARVIRLPYRRWLPERLMRKFRAYSGLLEILRKEKPDVILFHGLCAWELLTVKRYKDLFPGVRIFADSHEDFNNSARTFFSKYLLHGAYYRSILKCAIDSIEKVLCISIETISFVCDFYDVPADRIEFYPLGGVLFDDEEYLRLRESTRAAYGVGEGEILFVQSGKMDATKKVLESLRAFSEIVTPGLHFLLAGHLQEDVQVEAEEIIQKDPRIRFLGWKSTEELRALLCAADVYVQPGTQSATMQMSLCSRCAVILDDVPSHEPYIDGNGWLLGERVTLEEAFLQAAAQPGHLSLMAQKSGELAARILDYRKLAARLYV